MTLVLFDIGGVLVRIRHTWNEVLAAIGAESTLAEQWCHHDYKPLADYQAGSLDEAAYLAILARDLSLSPDMARAAHEAILDRDYDGAHDLVRRLRATGVKTACLSNTNALHWTRFCSAEHFPAVAGLDRRFASFEIGANKPDPAAFAAIERAYPGRRKVYFDDLERNVEGARRAGWEAFGVDPNGDPPAEMEAILAELGVLTRAPLAA